MNWNNVIFLAHAQEDKGKVKKLYHELKKRGFEPWLDEFNLDPGELWDPKIMEAITKSRFFIACLSKTSIEKNGYINKELKKALSVLEKKNQDNIYLIPALLEDIEIPDISVNSTNIRDYQAINISDESGVTRLMNFLSKQLNLFDVTSGDSRLITSSSEIKKGIQIKKLIGEGNTSKALEIINEYSENTDFHTNAILLSSRYNTLITNWNSGTIIREVYLSEINRLNLAIIETSNAIEKDVVSSLTPKDSQSEINNFNPILRFLYDKNIEIKTYQIDEDIDETLDTVALFMGNKYSHIKDIHLRIKQGVNNERIPPSFDLRRYPLETRDSIIKYCQFLHKIGFLSEYRYLKAPNYRIIFTPSKLPLAQKFVTGEWMERYLKAHTIKLLKNNTENTINYSFMKNIQILLPDQINGEIDLIFSINKEIFWLESRSKIQGKTQEKLLKISKAMKIKPNNALLVLSEDKTDDYQILSKSIGMEVISISTFNAWMLKAISKIDQNNDDEN